MFGYGFIFALCLLTLTTAKPYTHLGSSQLDVRNNYNSASGYSTSIGYTSPLGARIIASPSPFGYSAPIARYIPSNLQGPLIAARYESPALGAGYVPASYSAAATAPFASPYVQAINPIGSNIAPNYVSPYTTAYGSPYTFAAAPGSGSIYV